MKNQVVLWVAYLRISEFSVVGLEETLASLTIVSENRFSYIGKVVQGDYLTPWGSSHIGIKRTISIIGGRPIGGVG